MDKIELTEEELQAKINEAVAKKEEEMRSNHNRDMATQRKKADEEIQKAILKATEDAKLTAEEKAKKDAEEELNNLRKQNAELEAFKQKAKITEGLAKNNLPTFLVNDARLVNAKTDEELAKCIEEVKKDYSSSLPNGANVNTNVNNTSGKDNKSEQEKENESYRHLGLY